MKITIEGTAKEIAELLPALMQVKTRSVIKCQKQEAYKPTPEMQILNAMLEGMNEYYANPQESPQAEKK